MKESEKKARIKKGKQPSVSSPNIVLIKHAVIMLMLITEKQVTVPVRRSKGIEPEVLYPTEKAARSVKRRHIRPIII
jgi:hypothetical protein